MRSGWKSRERGERGGEGATVPVPREYREYHLVISETHKGLKRVRML